MKSIRSRLYGVLIVLCLCAGSTSFGQVYFSHMGSEASGADSGHTLRLLYHATQQSTILRLTESKRIQYGACWLMEKQQVDAGFSTYFEFQITDRAGSFPPDIVTEDVGGDGFAFVIQNVGTDAIGGAGGGLCYAGIPNSLAIEFDTWDNMQTKQVGVRDVDDNHIGVHTRGIDPNSECEALALGQSSNLPELSDGEVHTARIDYVPGQLAVFIDDNEIPVITVKVDLEETLALDEGKAWVGFTAATWDAYENHDILRWAFTATP